MSITEIHPKVLEILGPLANEDLRQLRIDRVHSDFNAALTWVLEGRTVSGVDSMLDRYAADGEIEGKRSPDEIATVRKAMRVQNAWACWLQVQKNVEMNRQAPLGHAVMEVQSLVDSMNSWLQGTDVTSEELGITKSMIDAALEWEPKGQSAVDTDK